MSKKVKLTMEELEMTTKVKRTELRTVFSTLSDIMNDNIWGVEDIYWDNAALAIVCGMSEDRVKAAIDYLVKHQLIGVGWQWLGRVPYSAYGKFARHYDVVEIGQEYEEEAND